MFHVKKMLLAVCMLLTVFLAGCETGGVSGDMPESVELGGVRLVSYHSEVTVDNETIDHTGLVYEEDPMNYAGRDGNFTLKVYVTAGFIKKYVDPKMKYSDGTVTFRVNNNTVTVTDSSIWADNERFGRVSDREAEVIDIGGSPAVEYGDIADIIGMYDRSHHRPSSDDNYMVITEIFCSSEAIGDLYTVETYDPDIRCYIKGFKREKPEGIVIGVNNRGNYIYQSEDGSCFIEANGVYYPIYTEAAIRLQ